MRGFERYDQILWMKGKRSASYKSFLEQKQRSKLMKQHVKTEEKNPFGNALEEVLREGARKLLQQAIENEVTEFEGLPGFERRAPKTHSNSLQDSCREIYRTNPWI